MLYGRVAMALGALLGLTGVILGALIAHRFKPGLEADAFNTLQRAVDFQLLHALLAVALGSTRQGRLGGWRMFSAFMAILGTLAFSGTIYLRYLTTFHALDFLAPVGGTLLMLSWVGVFFTAWREVRPPDITKHDAVTQTDKPTAGTPPRVVRSGKVVVGAARPATPKPPQP